MRTRHVGEQQEQNQHDRLPQRQFNKIVVSPASARTRRRRVARLSPCSSASRPPCRADPEAQAGRDISVRPARCSITSTTSHALSIFFSARVRPLRRVHANKSLQNVTRTFSRVILYVIQDKLPGETFLGR